MKRPPLLQPQRPAQLEHLDPGTAYHSVAGLAGHLFRCQPYSATIRVATCQDRFARAQTETGEALNAVIRCRTCPLGATHSGQPVSHFSPIFKAMICPRCGKGTTRMIGNLRCVSCFNRDQEFKKGKNSKGTKLVKLKAIDRRSVLVAVAGEGGPTKVLTHSLDRCVDSLEVIIDALRKIPGRLMFSRAFVSPMLRQAPPQ